MDLEALQTTLRQFAAERDWQPFHTPKNLAMALLVEAAELAEIFQWMTPEQSVAARGDAVTRERIGDEVADVLLYLLQIADHSAVDLKRAVGRKLVKNARKHPPLRPGMPAGAVAAAPAETHVLLDYENVQPSEDELRALVPDMTDLWLFHGPHQKGLGERFASLGERMVLVPIEQRGKNSLDFHLSFYVGYVAARHPDAQLVVVANDKGYEPMLGHAKALGFAARQLGHARVARTAAKRVAGTAATRGARSSGKAKAAPAPAAATKKRSARVPAAKVASAPPPAPVQSADKTTPSRRTRRPSAAPAPTRAAEPPTQAPPQALKPAPSTRGTARQRPAKAPRAAVPSGAPVSEASPAPKAVPKQAQAGPRSRPRAASAGTSQPTPPPSTRPPRRKARAEPPEAQAQAQGTPPTTHRRATQAAVPDSRAPATAPQAAAAPAGRLAEVLLRMGARRPRKLASLRRHLASFLGVAVDSAAAQAALDTLLADGLVTLGDAGAVSYRG